MYAMYIMRRTQIYLAEDQDRLLGARADALGTTKSAVIRDAIDAFLGEAADQGDTALARFRTALADSAGVASHLPSGRDYVERSRAADAVREAELSARRAR